MSRKVIDPESVATGPPEDSTASSMHYHQGVVVDGHFYMSGQVGWNAEFEVVGEDVASQARRAFENTETVLAEAGRDFEEVTKVTAYLVDTDEHMDEFVAVWEDVFDEPPYPCLSILGVERLGRPELLVEIEVEVPPESE